MNLNELCTIRIKLIDLNCTQQVKCESIICVVVQILFGSKMETIERMFTRGLFLYYVLCVYPEVYLVCRIYHRPRCQLYLSHQWVRALKIIDSQGAWLGWPPNTNAERLHLFVLCYPKQKKAQEG